jgi:uncharacterized Zn finger protein
MDTLARTDVFMGHTPLWPKGGAAMRYDDDYPPYVPVAERRAKAEKTLQQLRQKQPNITPVIIAGTSLATTWWGKSWNRNLERYADYSNRIGRGRSYVRHRAVLDLQLSPGNVTAMVQGSRAQPYDVVINVDTLSTGHWTLIREACAGRFDSLSELLAGQFPQALKDLFFEKGAGLFPSPREIHFDCSCPDWASMCKHVAAALYGVGVRLDDDPSLFFTLRGINMDDIITQMVTDTAQTLLHKVGRQSQHMLKDVDLGDVFGIQMDDIEAPLPDLPPVWTNASPPGKTPTRAPKAMAAQKRRRVRKTLTTQRSVPQRPHASAARTAAMMSATVRKARHKSATITPSALAQGTMLDRLVKAVGKARQGQSVDQLQAKLGWTTTQVRNAIHRAGVKGLIEMINPGVYRQKV